MHPVVFEVPDWHIRVLSVQVMVALAVVTALWLTPRLAATRAGLDLVRTRRLTLLLGVVALLGARLHFALTHWSLFAARPWEVLAVWSGGRHAGGAVLALLLVGPLAARAVGVPFLRLADCGAIAVMAALAVARVGCFLHGCCFGPPCEWLWCLTFPATSPAFNIQQPLGSLPPGATRSLPVHPLALYFAAAALITAVIGHRLHPHRRYDGQVMLVVLLLFQLASAALELLRYDHVGRVYWGGWPQLLWTALALAALAAVALAMAEVARRVPAGEGLATRT